MATIRALPASFYQDEEDFETYSSEDLSTRNDDSDLEESRAFTATQCQSSHVCCAVCCH
jgi:preprotein translocase subunit Sec63